jgi:general secretion pathway protein D
VKFHNSWRQIAAILCALAVATPPVDAKTKQGDKLLKLGAKAEADQDYDKAVTYYEQALQEDAREPAYQLAAQRAKKQASGQHLTAGRKLLEQQKLNEALIQFQKALLIDPSSPVSLQLVMQASGMIKERDKAPAGTVILTPAERARRDLALRINALEGPPVLRPINNLITSLKMNNQTSRVIYESIGKLAGINVLFDPAGIDTLGSTAHNFNLDLNNATLEEALQYVALLTHTFWKPISRNAIFVTQESEPKRQEYQDEVVRVFYVQNASTPNEFTEIFNAVRIGSKLTQGLFQVASQNAIVARGTPDTMALIEKLLHDLDRPKAEVLIDVMVWEVTKSKVTNLGLALQGSNILSVSPGSPTSTTTTTGTTPSTTSTSTGSISLSRIGKLSTNDFSLTLPGAIAQALLTDSNSKLLQNPQVRITDGGKGSLKIGEKIPYVSGSLNSAVATPGSIPYATTQFQQIDVGVNIDVSPHVNGPDDISMHIKVEISSVVSTSTIAGVAQPVIGQKVNEADVRMRDGEYSLLGGLSSDSDSLSVSGLPGVANIPVLGYLFGTRAKDREKDDILIALVPHIIRAQTVDDQTTEGVLAGTERMVKVERRHEQPSASPNALPPAVQPGTPGPVMPVPNAAVPNASIPNTPVPAAPVPGPPVAPSLPPPGGRAGLLPPTNNPRMAISGADGGMPVASQVEPPQPQLGPGSGVTPLQEMQLMGLAADPLPAAVAPVADAAAVKPTNPAKVQQLASGASIGTTATQAAKTGSSSADAARAKSSTPGQPLEGHLTQDAATSSTTPVSPKSQ